jgi:hypothetical protein
MMTWEIIKNNRGRPTGAEARVTVSYRRIRPKRFVLSVNIPEEVLERLMWKSRPDWRKVVVEQDGALLRLRLRQPDYEEDVWSLQTSKKGPRILTFSMPHLMWLKEPKPAEEVRYELQPFGSEQALIITLPEWARPPMEPEEEAFEMLESGKARGARDLMEEFGWTQAKALEVAQAWRAKKRESTGS